MVESRYMAFVSICLLWGIGILPAQAGLPYDKGQKLVYAAVGSYDGVNDRKTMDMHHLGLGVAYYITDGLGLYGEVLAIAGRGKHEGSQADTEGLGGFFALRWHFIRQGRWSAYLNHGIGPIWFAKAFPPGGTKLNALTQYGVGVSAAVGNTSIINIGLRHSHVSNGKGGVDDNPSFDGRGIYLEFAKPF